MKKLELLPLLEKRNIQNFSILNTIKEINSEANLSLNIDSGPWIAGGSVRKIIEGEDLGAYSDIDIFFSNADEYESALTFFETNHKERYTTSNAVSFNTKWGKVQVVKKQFHKSVGALLNSFDISICQVATDGRYVVFGPHTKQDLDRKQFRFNKIQLQATAIPRFVKYCCLGYSPIPSLATSFYSMVLVAPEDYSISKTTFY